jgi:hypothetical protein
MDEAAVFDFGDRVFERQQRPQVFRTATAFLVVDVSDPSNGSTAGSRGTGHARDTPRRVVRGRRL